MDRDRQVESQTLKNNQTDRIYVYNQREQESVSWEKTPWGSMETGNGDTGNEYCPQYQPP